MNHLSYRPFYQRHLPHFQPSGATLFVTFRLKGSIPQAVLDQLIAERSRSEAALSVVSDPVEQARLRSHTERVLFGKWDAELDTARQSPRWLEDPRVAQMVADCLRHRDNVVYNLHAFCIMPNHVHLVCTPLAKLGEDYHSLSAILHALKSYTAHEANRILVRRGAFWQQESYDHVVRDDEELRRVVTYVLNNPVKARLVEAAHNWPWSYAAV